MFFKFPDAGKCFFLKTKYFGKLEKVDKLKAWKRALKINQVKFINFTNDDFFAQFR